MGVKNRCFAKSVACTMYLFEVAEAYNQPIHCTVDARFGSLILEADGYGHL